MRLAEHVDALHQSPSPEIYRSLHFPGDDFGNVLVEPNRAKVLDAGPVKELWAMSLESHVEFPELIKIRWRVEAA